MKLTIFPLSKHRTGVFAALLLFCSVGAYAGDGQTSLTNDLIHARRVLKGIDTDKSKEWAVSVLRDAVEKDTSACAMNLLGLAYMSGAGVEQDTARAIVLLRFAGEGGYADAYHNLGLAYKKGRYGMSQNFKKAYECYVEGARLGSKVCKCDAGYMLYKGLGCKQDYVKAAQLFEESANADYSPSQYMLGLCYRNGYGVGQDLMLATEYLERSAMQSFSPAMEELLRPYPENYPDEKIDSEKDEWKIPEQMPDIAPAVNDISLLNGQYRGFVVMYDWSGKYLLGEKPVVLDIMSGESNEMTGVLVMGNDSIRFHANITNDGRMRFTDGKVKLNERYTVGKKVTYRMNEAVLDIWDSKIVGSLSLYSLKEKEPERPMYIELLRDGSTGKDDVIENNPYESVVATPNPFNYSFDATFELAEASDVKVRLFDKNGLPAYSQNQGFVDAGKQTITITPDVPDGMYVLNISTAKHVYRTIIIKKGGK